MGIDGSGKTTQAMRLFAHFKKRYKKTYYIWCRWEPSLISYIVVYLRRGKKWYENESSSMMKRSKDYLFRIFLFRWLWILWFIIDYRYQIFLKIDLLGRKKNKLIISDRYIFDSILDLALNLKLSNQQLYKLLDNPIIKRIILYPELVIYIDCPEEVARKRKINENSEAYLEVRRKMYKKLAEYFNWKNINGARPINEVFTEIKSIINENTKSFICLDF